MFCEGELKASASFLVPNNPLPTYGSTIITFLKKKKKKKTLLNPSVDWPLNILKIDLKRKVSVQFLLRGMHMLTWADSFRRCTEYR